MELSIGGHRVWVETIGFGGALVTLHGGPGLDHSWFRPALDPLASKAKVVYYDQADCGRSARDVPLANGFGTWVDELDGLRAALGVERMVLLGHSGGSMLALSYAVRFPAHVAGMVLIAAAPKFDFVPAAIEEGRRLHGEAAIQKWTAAVSQPARDDAHFRQIWREVLPLYVHRYDAAALDPVEARALYSAAALSYGLGVATPAFDVTAQLGSIRAKTLLVSGKYDWICPLDAGPRRVAAGIPGARLEVFEQSAHFPFLEEPARFVKVVGDFLDALE
jgi:proline iminopeptidase